MKILSIEISERITKVLETDYKKESPKVYNSFAFKTPKDVFTEGKVIFQKEFRIQLLHHLAEKGIRTKKALFVVNSSKIASRMVEIPNIKINKIQTLLEENINDYFPVDLEQYQVAYRLASERKIQKGEMRSLFVIAVPKDIIGSYYNLAQQSGLEFVSLDYEGNSIFQIIKNLDVQERQVFLEIGENSSTVTITDGQDLEMQRTFYYGLGEAVDKIKESPYCEGESISAQFKAIKQERYLHFEGTAEEEDIQLHELRVEVMEVVQPIVNNITRIIKYFASQNPDAPFLGCTLLGMGIYFKGLSELLEEELGLEIHMIDDHAKMINKKAGMAKINEATNLASFLVSYGAVIEPMNLMVNNGKKNNTGLTIIPNDSLSIGILVLALSAVASLALMVTVFIPHVQLRNDIKELGKKQTELASAQVVQDQYVVAENSAKDITMMETTIKGPANDLAEILEEMEDILPSQSYAESISADEVGITMSMNSPSKREVAKVLEQLKTMKYFSEINVSSISSEDNETGSKSVKYTIICSFPIKTTDEIQKEGN